MEVAKIATEFVEATQTISCPAMSTLIKNQFSTKPTGKKLEF